MARRDRVSGWLAVVPEVDRRLVAAVIEQLGRGASRPDWMALRAVFRNRNGAAYGAEGLRMRYRRALKAMAGRLGFGGRLDSASAAPHSPGLADGGGLISIGDNNT